MLYIKISSASDLGMNGVKLPETGEQSKDLELILVINISFQVLPQDGDVGPSVCVCAYARTCVLLETSPTLLQYFTK